MSGRHFSHIVLYIPWPQRPQDCFDVRLQPQTLCDEGLQLFTLRCAGIAHGKGAVVRIVSDEGFWRSDLSLFSADV